MSNNKVMSEDDMFKLGYDGFFHNFPRLFNMNEFWQAGYKEAEEHHNTGKYDVTKSYAGTATMDAINR